ncbi:CCNI2 protein, partial [Crypturellus undulatus]|nr:CCNI2 protein [Crypturellus undulatus]
SYSSPDCSLCKVFFSLQAQLKYLECIAISCLVLAAKTSQEDEVIPSVKTLAAQSGSKRSPAEILRMERILLEKPHWDLYTATPMDFLSIVSIYVYVHRVLRAAQTKPSRHAALRTRQLQHCSACHQLLQPRGSTLALVISTLELQTLAPDGAPAGSDLLREAQVGS